MQTSCCSWINLTKLRRTSTGRRTGLCERPVCSLLGRNAHTWQYRRPGKLYTTWIQSVRRRVPRRMPCDSTKKSSECSIPVRQVARKVGSSGVCFCHTVSRKRRALRSMTHPSPQARSMSGTSRSRIPTISIPLASITARWATLITIPCDASSRCFARSRLCPSRAFYVPRSSLATLYGAVPEPVPDLWVSTSFSKAKSPPSMPKPESRPFSTACKLFWRQ